MQLCETFLLICGKTIVGGWHRRAFGDGRAEWAEDGGHDVVDNSADAKAMELDDIAGSEGIVRVVNEVGGVRSVILRGRER